MTQAVCCFVSFRYESSAAEYKSTLEEAFKVEGGKSHQGEQKAKDSSSPSNAVTAFLVNEVQLEITIFHMQCVVGLQYDSFFFFSADHRLLYEALILE